MREDTISFLEREKIKLKLKFLLIEPYKVKELIYHLFLWTFSFNNRGLRLNNHNEEEQLGRHREMKLSLSAIISGVFQVIWHVKCLSAVLELNCVLFIVIVVN